MAIRTSSYRGSLPARDQATHKLPENCDPTVTGTRLAPATQGLFEYSGWCAWKESNLLPFGPEPNALSGELQARDRLTSLDCGPRETADSGDRDGRDRGGVPGIKPPGTNALYQPHPPQARSVGGASSSRRPSIV